MRLLKKLVLAHKDLAHRVFEEDVSDGVGEERGDREHVYLIARLAALQGQGVGDDDLFYRGFLESLVRRTREYGVRGRSVDLCRSTTENALCGPHGGPAGIYYVVYHDRATVLDVADDVRHL